MTIRSRRFPIVAYLEALPLASVFLVFFVVPIALVVVVSFFSYETYRILIPAFTLDNFRDVFSESVTYRTYLTTVKFCHRVGDYGYTRFLHCLLSRLSTAQSSIPDSAPPRLLDTVFGPRL